MADVQALFWDIGGVVLTNAWDREARRRAAERFGLNLEEFQERHYGIVAEFEKGQLGLADYLDCAVFHRPRAFSREDFKQFMFNRSRPKDDSLALVEALARTGRYLMTTLNNESLELNRYRIEQFGLRRYFTVFFSSSFVGSRKPERHIYEVALQVTQRRAEDCVFIDDRPANLEAAARLGLRTVHFQSASQARSELATLGVGTDS